MIRNTRETEIYVELYKDGGINTGDPVLDHMVKTMFFYANIPVTVNAKFDLRHHLWEDLGITIGLEINRVKKDNIKRYGYSIIPMDDALIICSIDFSRSYLNMHVDFKDEEGFEISLIHEFLNALSRTSNITMHFIKMSGENAHHISECMFKALGFSLRSALEASDRIESTKGSI
ncbi:imidazoleglycerol-phosphate dehydratase HisB [Picrophilus oshimae]|uniref:Imidazole glycerol phosphate dehydratase n=1 Tax=Picrophilus torridus (strain ATCC 700027 / DSM 9790 / JCM 10055 / NBRC 100828 / KAW 2/3) TaxID=1122961 RepID=Q6KZD2_PICTO|nr:imidazoleglycerol-phosphate dehydratase HisB [Picrophilus oshimae]AAT43920.1 imidazole glycerol phosphate dehydratase [Picrophilus oshimae DSM 9789]